MPLHNTRLRAAREALISSVTGYSLSRDELAEAVNAWAYQRGISINMSGNYIGKFERGAVRWPHQIYRDALRAVLRADTDAALGFSPPGAFALTPPPSAPIIANTHHVAHRPKSDEDKDDDMRRRQLLLGTTAAAGLIAITPFPRDLVARSRIDMSTADQLAARVDSYVSSEQRFGGGTLAQSATRDLEQAQTMLQTHDIDAAAITAFVSAVGNLAVMAGWLHYDSDNQTSAINCYRDALALATEIGDDELAAHTCLNKSLLTSTQARRGKANPHHALHAALRAAELARTAPAGRIHALIAARQALAHSCLGDRSAFTRSITAARHAMDLAYDREPLDQCPDWLQFVCHTEIRYHQACGTGYLGDVAGSTKLFEQAATERAAKRNAAHYRAWYACSLAQIGNITDAVTEADAVLTDLTTDISSDRTMRVLQPVYDAATEPRHSGFRERYDQLSIQA